MKNVNCFVFFSLVNIQYRYSVLVYVCRTYLKTYLRLKNEKPTFFVYQLQTCANFHHLNDWSQLLFLFSIIYNLNARQSLLLHIIRLTHCFFGYCCSLSLVYSSLIDRVHWAVVFMRINLAWTPFDWLCECLRLLFIVMAPFQLICHRKTYAFRVEGNTLK